MCLDDGISMTTPLTPVSTARLTSSFMQRAKEKICGPEVALDDFLDRLVVGRRHDRHAGFDAVHAGFGQASAMRIFSSLERMTPVCCSPSRSVTSWILMFLANLKSLVTSGA